MIKKFFVSVALAITAMSASAALPSVILKDLDGKSVDTATLSNDGKPYVVTFWATWCKPCLRELGAIQEVIADWEEETGVKVYAVSIDEGQNVEKVKPLLTRKGLTDFTVLLDSNSEFKRQMGVSDPPQVFVVDGEGNITWTHQGYVDGGEAEILEAVKKALK